MLGTLNRIGKQLLEGKGDWARLCAEPKSDPGKKSWVVPIILNVDSEEMSLGQPMVFHNADAENPSAITYRYINTGLWGPRGKKCCVSCEPKNFGMLTESLFGKSEEDSGSMAKAYDEFYPDGKSSAFRDALHEIGKMSDKMDEFDLNAIKKQINFPSSEEAVLFYVLIKSEKTTGIEPKPLFELEGYEDFVKGKFLKDKGKQGLDYLTGLPAAKVSEAVFSSRYNLNKVFQTTTFNYASEFDGKAFSNNFQAEPGKLAFLDKASDFILKKSNRITIAGLPHIIVPNYLDKDLGEIHLQDLQVFLSHSKELLFSSNDLERSVRRELPDMGVFWLNYIAYESDGNSFKIINHIKDVNSLHLKRVIYAFKDATHIFREYIVGKYGFNLQSVYRIIPVREGSKEKRNEALVLFKKILEQRKVEPEMLYENFSQFLKLHQSGQFDSTGKHRGFPNIKKKEKFEYAVYEGVYKYLALESALDKLNLITMTEIDNELATLMEAYPNEQLQELYQIKNGKISRNTAALFCLGRALNAVAYGQELKNHPTRPILKKVNFNGMSFSDVLALIDELHQKGFQYQEVKTKTGRVNVRKQVDIYTDLFSKYLDETRWKEQSEKEVLFYLMAGYVFRKSKTSNEPENDNN